MRREVSFCFRLGGDESEKWISLSVLIRNPKEQALLTVTVGMQYEEQRLKLTRACNNAALDMSAGDTPSVHAGLHAGLTQNKPTRSIGKSKSNRSDAFEIE